MNARRCLNLGLDGDPEQVMSEASPCHRCYAFGASLQVGNTYQGKVCLTPDHDRCRRPSTRPLQKTQSEKRTGGTRLNEVVPLERRPALLSQVHRPVASSFHGCPSQPAQTPARRRFVPFTDMVPLPRSAGWVSRFRQQTTNTVPGVHGWCVRAAVWLKATGTRLRSTTKPDLSILAGRIVKWLAGPSQDRATPPRRMTVAEILAWSFSISVILAFFIVGSAILYRPPIGYAMDAAANSTSATEMAAVQQATTLGHTAMPPPLPATSTSTSPAGSLPTMLAYVPTQPAAIPAASRRAQPPPTKAHSLTPGQFIPTPGSTVTPSPRLPTPSPTPDAPRPPADSPPTRLVIPKIALDTPVLPVTAKTIKRNGRTRVIWDTLPGIGSFHQTSAYPGRPGNTVINGHRDIEGSVFLHLDKVEVGDKIILYVGDVAYPYDVTEILKIPYTLASAEQRTEHQRLISYMPQERLTLVTCTPVGLATHRLYVIARPPADRGVRLLE